MKKNLLCKMLVIAFIAFACCFEANAKWEQLYSIRAPYCMHIAPNGTMLVADYLTDDTGGIYYSEDGGTTWEKSDAPDYSYGKFIDAGEYIIATGRSCRIARSKDSGKTWEITNYSSAIADIVSERQLEGTICYAATMHNNRLYIGDFSGGGVLYSEDFGETWIRTNISGLQYDTGNGKPGKPSIGTETIYNLVSYSGKLLAFGVYFVFEYDEENDNWIVLRSDSNFMGQSTFYQGLLVCGRNVMNQTTETEFLITYDGTNWGEIPRPEGWVDNNVRCLASDDDFLFVGFQETGFLYSDNMGLSWNRLNDGLPNIDPKYTYEYKNFYQHLIDLEEDENYIYLIVYDTPFSTRYIDGIYRLAKSELERSSNVDISIDQMNVLCDGSFLYVGENASVVISDLSGRVIEEGAYDGKVDLQNLTPGAYIYNVECNGQISAGKFIKK